MKHLLVYNRLRLQRGQAFAGMLFSTVTVVGVWRGSFPMIPWWALCLIGGAIYLTLAWAIGYVDERMGMFRIEQERYSTMNPQLLAILETVKRLEKEKNT